MKKYIIGLVAASAIASAIAAYADVPCSHCSGSGSSEFQGQRIQCNWCQGSGRRAR